jgi:uncharacterized Zn-binding protein involved in type VI secretion
MPAVQRQGDKNTNGGAAKLGVASVRVNGKPIVVKGTSVTDDRITAGGSGTVRAGGKPVIRTGDVDTSGSPRVGGSPDVRAG